MCWEKCDYNTSEDGHQHGKPSYLLIVVKTKVKSAFQLWHHHRDTNTTFQLKLANFLVPQPPFYDFVANNFINFLKLSRQRNNISFNSNLIQASSLKFWQWEWWVFRFPIWAYQGPSTWFIFGWKLETYSSAGSKPSATTRNEALANLVHVFQLHSNANNNEGVLVLSWIKRVRIFQNKRVVQLFNPSSATFLYQIINDT